MATKKSARRTRRTHTPGVQGSGCLGRGAMILRQAGKDSKKLPANLNTGPRTYASGCEEI